MKSEIKLFTAAFLYILIISGCTNRKIYANSIVEQYGRNTHWGSDVISIRQGNTFTRETRLISCKTYYGKITISNDTLFLNYESNKKIKNQLNYVIKNDSSLTVFILYNKIKDTYAGLSSEELKKIKKKDLYIETAAAWQYKKRIIL